MAARFGRFGSFTRKLFGRSAVNYADPTRCTLGKQFVELENRAVPATFIVTNILDNQTDVTNGLSLRQAIDAANNNPGFDRIEFNIPRSPSLPTIPNDPTENYFPIVLATTLPDLTDPAGVTIDATTQPRNNINGTRPIIQLLPNPNPGAFIGSVGAMKISGPNNAVRGFVFTGFPGAAINLLGDEATNNIIVGNWINTDITGTRPWNEDPFIAKSRPAGTPPELTNTGPNPFVNPLFVLAGITITDGASDNVIGGIRDAIDRPLVDAGGKLIGEGGVIVRYNNATPPGGIPITPAFNRNIISGTPEFRKDYFQYTWALDGSTKVRARDPEGSGVGAGIRIMDPDTDRNLIQGNFIGTDVSGNSPIPNHNGIEIFNAARSNMIGNPTTRFTGDPVAAGMGNLIRFNEHDGVRLGSTPNPSQINPPPPPVPGPPQPYQEGYDGQTTTALGPFGPGGTAAFFDWLNPNYFTHVGNILSVGMTEPGTNGTTIPGISAQPGQTVTIRGSGLLSTTSVTFASAVAGQSVTAKFTVEDDSQLSVIVPFGAVTGNINVFTPAGSFKSPDVAVILPSPPAEIEIVSTFSPSLGTAGTKVTIIGTGFIGAQSVAFGGVLSNQFTVLPGGTVIEAIVPTSALSGPIVVTTPGGSASTVQSFQVTTQPPPLVTGISVPQAIPGQEVTLTGVNFTGAYLVRFNFTPGGSGGFATTDFVVDSSTQIRVKVPPLATLSKNPVQVVTSDGAGFSLDSLQINTAPLPAITSISSTGGPLGTILTINGTNFTSANRVTIGGIDAAKYTILSNSQIRAVVPNGLPLGFIAPVRVFSTGGTAVSAQNFVATAAAAPTIGPIAFANRNTFTVINGTNLLGTTKVLFGNATTGVPAPFVEVISDTQIRVQIPPSVPATGSFFVYTPFNTQNPLQPPASNTFNIANSATPSITVGRQTSPIAGVIGSLVTINGQGFTGTQEVLFQSGLGGTIPGTELTIVDDFTITVRVPLGAVTGTVTVVTPGVPDTDIPFSPADPIQTTLVPFTVLASPTPTITGLFPTSGPVGTLVNVSGKGFTGAVQVSFGSFVADEFEIFSDNLIRVRVPVLGADGPITVTTPGGVANSGSFDVTDAAVPTITFSSPRAARNTQITIAGTGLASTTKVQFNDVSAQFNIISDVLITAIVPIAAGPGEIRVSTTGGVASSPTPFTLESVAPPVIAAVGGQALESPDAAPAGSKIFVNGSGLAGVFRVEFGGGAVDFDILDQNTILFTIPEIDPGTYDVVVYASTKSDADGGNTGLGTNAAGSFSKGGNILGSVFEYGERITVLPSARPVIEAVATNDTALGVPVAPQRGAPIIITGRGFTGVNRVNIAGVDITNPNLFTVVDDTTIVTNIPITKLPGTAKIDDALVQVFTPHGVVGDPTDDLGSVQTGPEAQLDIIATAAFAFDAPAGAQFMGSQVTLTATSGNFYGVVQLLADAKDNSTPVGTQVVLGLNAIAPMVAPLSAPTFFQNFTIVPGTGGTVIQAVIPTEFASIPVPVNNTPPVPNTPAPPVPPTLANIQFHANTNAGNVKAATITQVGKVPTAVTLNSIASVATGKFNVFNNVYRIVGSKALIATTDITVDGAPGGAFGIARRNNIEVTVLGPNTVQLDFVLPTIRNPFLPIQTINWPTGGLDVNTTEGTGTRSFTPIAQQIPSLLVFTQIPDPVQDTRMLGNRTFDNGVVINRDANNIFTGVTIRDQATKFTDGNLGIDFVTSMPGVGAFPFAYGYARPDQGPQTSPPFGVAGNWGKGGLNDGLTNSFSQQIGISLLPTDPNFASILPGGQAFDASFASGSYTVQGKNTFNNVQYGRYFGPNLLQNFPLLQVVQSTVDRTTFSTALIAKPFRTYRIDYFYNPGVDNALSDAVIDPFLSNQGGNFVGSRFDDQDVTARATTNAGFGQIYLGSKLITTDANGDGSVSFDIERRLPTDPNDPNSVPPLQDGDFILPGNLPLVPSVIDPATGAVVVRSGVVVSTATDLTAPPPKGADLRSGPDGTSRFSFFQRTDTTTASISGQAIIDANNNGVIDSGESGLANAKVDLFVQRSDGQYNASPSVTVVTGDDGAYFFGGSTSGGYGLPNGVHKLALTLPTGKIQYFYSVPANGQQNVPIISGETVTGKNFLVVTTPTGTPPTISDIPNQNVSAGTIIAADFTVNDAETPADQLVVEVISSSNPGFIPVSNVIITGFGANRTVTIATPAGVQDSSIITIRVTDGNGLFAEDSFLVNTGVVGPNTPPTITPIANQTGTAGQPLGPITFTIGDAETPPNNLIVTRLTSNGNAIPLSNIVLGGTGADRTVTINVPAGVIGASTISLIVTDIGGLSSQTQFVVDVPPPPGTAPTLLAIGSDAGRIAEVNVYNPNGSFRYSLQPYGPGYTGGVRVAVGDVTGDGNADIITAPGIGIGGLVKIFDGITGDFLQQYLPYGDEFRGGVYVVTGDVDGDGINELITGTGKGGGPRVQVRRGGLQGGTSLPLETIADFFPYEANFRGGVLVSAGDVNGDGKADIGTGTGPGGGPRVRILDGTNLSSTPGVGTLYDFFAYDNRVRSGVFATIGDVDGDGQAEIITGPGGGGPAVKIFKQSDISPGAPTFDVNGSQQFLASKSFFAYDPTNYNGGVRVDVLDGNGDGVLDIVTGPGRGIGPDVRVVNYATLQDIYRVQAFEATFNGGVWVGGNES